MRIMGIEKVDYVSEKTGRQVRGYRVHFVQDYGKLDDNHFGVRCGSEYISASAGDPYFDQFSDLNDALGQEIDFNYRRFGRNFQIDGIYSVVGK